jgi:hypothetical protein
MTTLQTSKTTNKPMYQSLKGHLQLAKNDGRKHNDLFHIQALAEGNLRSNKSNNLTQEEIHLSSFAFFLSCIHSKWQEQNKGLHNISF